jgi:hypothetical protein
LLDLFSGALVVKVFAEQGLYKVRGIQMLCL